MESVLVHWTWAKATRRGIPIRSKSLCETTRVGMRNHVLARIRTSAIYGWAQNSIRNKSVYDCYRQSLIFGKIKNSLTNTADVLEFSKTSNFVMAISQEVSEIWKNVSYQIHRAEKNNMWTSVWKTKKNMILGLNMSLFQLWCPQILMTCLICARWSILLIK